MKYLIYQYWTGNVPFYARESSTAIENYARYVGAEYRFDHNPKPISSKNAEYLNAFRAVYDDAFHEYDKVLFLDMDIFPTESIRDNIFEQEIDDIGICEELHQPELRQKMRVAGISSEADNNWAKQLKQHWDIDHPRDTKGRCRVFNSGVVMYTQEGMKKAKDTFINFSEYTQKINGLSRFYVLDQNYLNANLFANKLKWTVMPVKWNTQIHYVGDSIHDIRDKSTNFVHLQLRRRNELTTEMIYDIVNKPIKEWRHL